MSELYAQLERTPVEVRSLGHRMARATISGKSVLFKQSAHPRPARMTMKITAGFCLGYTIAATRHSANTVMVNTLQSSGVAITARTRGTVVRLLSRGRST
jgi:hypothetical protein